VLLSAPWKLELEYRRHSAPPVTFTLDIPRERYARAGGALSSRVLTGAKCDEREAMKAR